MCLFLPWSCDTPALTLFKRSFVGATACGWCFLQVTAAGGRLGGNRVSRSTCQWICASMEFTRPMQILEGPLILGVAPIMWEWWALRGRCLWNEILFPAVRKKLLLWGKNMNLSILTWPSFYFTAANLRPAAPPQISKSSGCANRWGVNFMLPWTE